MLPKYFAVTTWDISPRATCDERRFAIDGSLPWDFQGPLSFHLGPVGHLWHDIMLTTIGILLFSQKTVSALQRDGISGLTFYDATIRLSGGEDPRLKKKPQPTYFWGRAKGLVQVDLEYYRQFRRYVPIQVTGDTQSGFFHLVRPDRPPAGYSCTVQVLETFRRHKIGNLWVTPLDYYKVDKMNFKPPFRIDVLGKKWPPASWYPEGFVPHPNNLV